MRKWTAAADIRHADIRHADIRHGAALPPVRYSDDGTALSAASSMAPAPSTTAKARMVRWPRLLGLTLGVWSVSYLARQALTWGSADMPFSPLGSFALEGIALAVVAIGAVIGWSLVALAALRGIEHAASAAPVHCAVIVQYSVPARTGHPAWSSVRRAAARRDHRAAA